MEGDRKKSLKTAIIEFYKLNSNKGKEYTFKHFKNGGVHKATIYRWIEKIEKTGNLVRKPGTGFANRKVTKQIKNKILTSLLKFQDDYVTYL